MPLIGAGKTTLVELLASRAKSGIFSGSISFPTSQETGFKPRIGFVPQQDILPPALTVYEALLFAARLKLPESVPEHDKVTRVLSLIEKLGLSSVKDSRIGKSGGGERGGKGGKASGGGRGISGGEMRRVSIGIELVGAVDVLVLDEPTSGLDSTSALRLVKLLGEIARGDSGNGGKPVPVVCSVHQPGEKVFRCFDKVVLMARGRAVYVGEGGMRPREWFAEVNSSGEKEGGKKAEMPEWKEGYNVAEWLLDLASEVGIGGASEEWAEAVRREQQQQGARGSGSGEHIKENGNGSSSLAYPPSSSTEVQRPATRAHSRSSYTTTFLTQLTVLSSREMKLLRRDKSLFIAHVGVSCVLGVFCGGLYFNTGITIAGFQSRVGCLFFLVSLLFSLSFAKSNMLIRYIGGLNRILLPLCSL
jgi:ABC-type multidrug transport system ATPase subunit